jgi:3-hydroxybutyryl-CoA dehydratase
MDHHDLPDTLVPARMTVSAAAIAAYADLTQDFNPIHVDATFAATTAMGGVIAHGTMSIGLIWQSLQRSAGAEAFVDADLDIRFVKPVRLAETLVASGARRAHEPGVYDVWVRAVADDSDRLVGSLTLATSTSA